MRIFLAFVVCTNFDRSARPDRGAHQRAGPLGHAVRSNHPELEQAVVGARVVEDLDTAEDLADVAGEDAAAVAVEPTSAVDVDRGPEGLQPEVLRARPEVRGPAVPLLEVTIGVVDHQRVEAGASQHGEAFAVDPPDVDRPPITVQPDLDGAFEIDRDAEVVCEEVAGTGWQNRQRDRIRADGIDAPLNDAVAAPDEQQVSPSID